MKLSSVVVFGVGYVMGTKAGRERYAQIVTVAQKIGQRLEEYSARDDAGADVGADADPGVDFTEQETAVRGSRRRGFGDRAFASHPSADA